MTTQTRKRALATSRADRHRRTRDAHAAEAAQDYVELISELIAEHGEARAVDIARTMGVTQATVAKTIARLQRKGLVDTKPYRAIFLTPKGQRVASESRRRHRIVAEFLESLGVGSATAWADAEGIEHHVSAETLAAFAAHIAKLRKNAAKPRSG